MSSDIFESVTDWGRAGVWQDMFLRGKLETWANYDNRFKFLCSLSFLSLSPLKIIVVVVMMVVMMMVEVVV